MAAEAGAGIKRHEAERLGARGGDGVPDVNVQRGINALELVDERDVDAAKNIFQQLGRLGGAAVRHGNQSADGARINFLRGGKARGRVAADNFGNVGDVALGIAGVFALRRKREVKILAGFQSRTFFQDGAQFIFRRAGIGRGFEDDELAALQMRRNGFCRSGERRTNPARDFFSAAWERR